ncbi:MAG: Rieske 2Fe-2S domain-containing protein [Candidatus Nanopelagicales bacterium]
MSKEISPFRPQPAEIEHEYRRADIDAKAAKRAERQVAMMFALSAVFTVLFVVAFATIDSSTVIGLPVFGPVYAFNVAIGVTMGLAIFFIGAGAIHWAKKLMPDVEVEEERHDFGSTEEEKSEIVETFKAGAADSGVMQRPLIRRTLLAALALFPVPLVVLLRDLGPGPGDERFRTMWSQGRRLLTDVSYQPIRPEDVPIGNLINAVPEGLHELEEEVKNLNERAKSVIIVVRIDPDEIVSQQGGTPDEPWDYDGILAYSKVCTHVGCPISLYEQRTHHLLCPCHQSTYDLADSGKVIFGPAARRMPQLGITIDQEGYLVARGDFAEPIGPSFWELS